MQVENKLDEYDVQNLNDFVKSCSNNLLKFTKI